jgi:hypothetical protein
VPVDDFSVLVQTVDDVVVFERVDVVSEFHTGLWVVVVLALVVEEVNVVVLVDSVTGKG